MPVHLGREDGGKVTADPGLAEFPLVPFLGLPRGASSVRVAHTGYANSLLLEILYITAEKEIKVLLPAVQDYGEIALAPGVPRAFGVTAKVRRVSGENEPQVSP
jgi:hypothetical protein